MSRRAGHAIPAAPIRAAAHQNDESSVRRFRPRRCVAEPARRPPPEASRQHWREDSRNKPGDRVMRNRAVPFHSVSTSWKRCSFGGSVAKAGPRIRRYRDVMAQARFEFIIHCIDFARRLVNCARGEGEAIQRRRRGRRNLVPSPTPGLRDRPRCDYHLYCIPRVTP